MSKKLTPNQQRFYNIFQDEYRDKIDDFIEAKYEFLSDLNKSFDKHERGSPKKWRGFLNKMDVADISDALVEQLN